jgi:hypothetical protein
MNKVSAGVTLTATWPHAVREPIHQYRRSDQRAGASGSLPGQESLPGFTTRSWFYGTIPSAK